MVIVTDLGTTLTSEQRKAVSTMLMFRGAREFFLTYQLAAGFGDSPLACEGRAPRLIQSRAACASLALELALKARVLLDGGEPPSRGADGHDHGAIFKVLTRGAQEDIASLLRVGDEPATVEGLAAVLAGFKGTFQTWRYMHEGNVTPFDEGGMVAVIGAVFSSIVRLRPDFGPFPGVIVDPDRPVPWHLTPP